MLSGSGTVKIGDFGQSQFFDRRDTFNRTLGTPAYLGGLRGRAWVHGQQFASIPAALPLCAASAGGMSLSFKLSSLRAAPEVCAGETYRGRQADVWALGVSLYLFIFGEMPFKVRCGQSHHWPTHCYCVIPL